MSGYLSQNDKALPSVESWSIDQKVTPPQPSTRKAPGARPTHSCGNPPGGVAVGIGVLAGIGVDVGVVDGACVAVRILVGVGVDVEVAISVGILVGVGVDVDVAVAVGILVGEDVNVGEAVAVGCEVGVFAVTTCSAASAVRVWGLLQPTNNRVTNASTITDSFIYSLNHGAPAGQLLIMRIPPFAPYSVLCGLRMIPPGIAFSRIMLHCIAPQSLDSLCFGASVPQSEDFISANDSTWGAIRGLSGRPALSMWPFLP